LWAPLGFEVALEIRRHVEGTDGFAGADRANRRCEVSGALDDTESWRDRHLLDESARGFRSVGIDDDHPQPADHRIAERQG
jgi:hypothetical protein